MVFNIIDWEKDPKDDLYRKIHPTQKPIRLLEKLITIFTDPGDVVIDPVAGSGSTLIAAQNLGRKAYGFEIKKEFYAKAKEWIEYNEAVRREIESSGYSETLMRTQNPEPPTLFANA